jgi:hypothetical protein
MASLDQTDYAMDDGGCFPAEAGISLLIMMPSLLWALPGLLSNGYKGPFPRGKSARASSLPHPYLVPRLNAWSDTSSPPPPTGFNGGVVFKHGIWVILGVGNVNGR